VRGEKFYASAALAALFQTERLVGDPSISLNWKAMPEHPPTALISANELVVDFGHHVVLKNATLAIHEGERVGLVGKNGAGKTTFLKILAGEMEPDSGTVIRRRKLVTGYLSQSFTLRESATVGENIMDGAQHILQMIRDYEDPATDPERHDTLLEEINHFDGWNLDQRQALLMDHLNAPAADRIVSTLSGGEKRRVALCKALLSQPDFLILDEPTNHLDTTSIEWLEEFLSTYPGACLFVTHDRYFLDNVANRMVELAAGTFYSYTGTYTDFLEARALRKNLEEQEEEARQRFLKRELEWVRRRPKARRTKAKDRVERFHEEVAKEGPERDFEIDLIIPPVPKTANRILELEKASMIIEGKTLFSNLNLSLECGSRVGIVGRNGLGKTTLLKVMLGLMPPTSGKVIIGTQTRVNYVDQGRLLLDENKTILQEVGEGAGDYVQFGEERISIRGYLRRYLFPEERLNSKISVLSGGERSRVILAKILKRGGNLLVLDEPTNDLDLATLRLLEEALMAFKGTVVTVSHDRYFLNRICTGIIGFEGDGDIFITPGNYDYYLEKKASRPAQAKPSSVKEPEENPAAKKPPEPESSKPRKLKWKEQKELETMEETIHAAEAEVSRIQKLFEDPEFYKKHGDQWEEMDKQLVEGKKRIETLYARWAELEKIKAGADGAGT
jgi:ABC transport system ATP-binding/permease protein